MRALVSALALVLGVAAPVSAQSRADNWFVTVSSANNRVHSVTFIDANRITTRGPYLRAWIEAHFAEDARGVMARYSRAVLLTEYDCAERRSRVLQMTSYYRNQDTPNTTTDASGWEYETPHTAGEATLDFVCSTPSERESNENYVRLNGMPTAEAAANLFAARPE